MPFRFSARTLLQLGRELISSDGIAFYELIKNAFDAGSPRVDIDVDITLPSLETARARIRRAEDLPSQKARLLRMARRSESGYQAVVYAIQEAGSIEDLIRLLETEDPELSVVLRDHSAEVERLRKAQQVDSAALESLKAELLDLGDRSSSSYSRFQESLTTASTTEEVLKAARSANSITIRDTGCGMSLVDLEEIYLHIGTPYRLYQRQKLTGKPVLGEKGLGRLSTMRLGWQLRIETGQKGETRWSVLAIDWRDFAREPGRLVDDVPVAPAEGTGKKKAVSGTTITISDLSSDWTEKRLGAIAASEFSRLTDPFTPKARYPITLCLNGRVLPIPPLNRLLFEHANATFWAKLEFDSGNPRLHGHIRYTLRSRETVFSLGLSELVSLSEATPETLRSLGPFEVQAYWYNRRLLHEIEGIGDRKTVRALLSQWANGPMLFRDGFRVNPYGGPGDDWLGLDRTALSAPSMKVNRIQFLGKVDISSADNPRLIDQTNREGLRDTNEKKALVALLKHVIEGEFRSFLIEADKEEAALSEETIDEVVGRVTSHERAVASHLRDLVEKAPSEEVRDKVQALEAEVQELIGSIAGVRAKSKEIQKGRRELLHLASLGLMVEILAHELKRATDNALHTIAGSDTLEAPALATLQEQLRTLRKRLRVLDPKSTPGRQVKTRFDLLELLAEIEEAHASEFDREGISWEVTSASKKVPVKLVRGMVVQLLENLINNSVYWLRQAKSLDPKHEGRISVIVHPDDSQLLFTDNGPGVDPERRETIFQAFVTAKPPGLGKGLGLYISREIAEYHDGELTLTNKRERGRLHTFSWRWSRPS